MRRFVLTAFALTMFAACQPATIELTEEQKAEIADEIRQVAAGMIEAAEEVDIERWLSHWPPELEQRFQDQPALFVNRLSIYPTAESIRVAWEPSFAARSAHDIVTVDEYVAVLDADAALWVYEGTYTVSDTLGNTTEPAPWTVSVVWVRQSGEWKALHLHQSWNPAN